MSNRPLVLPLPASLAADQVDVASVVRSALRRQFGLVDSRTQPSLLFDPTTRTTVAPIALTELRARPVATDIVLRLSSETLESRAVAGFYAVGYYAPSCHSVVLLGYVALAEILKHNAARVTKRAPTRADLREDATWLDHYDAPLSLLRPLAQLSTYLDVLRESHATEGARLAALPADMHNGVNAAQVVSRAVNEEEIRRAVFHAHQRERDKVSSPETFHGTHANNYGSHTQGFLAEHAVAEVFGLEADTRVLARGDGGEDFAVPLCALGIDAKGTGNDWRRVPTDIRVKQEHVKWGVVSQIYLYIAISKTEQRTDILGWATLDEVMRVAPPRRLRGEAKYPINYLFPIAHLRPPATLRALVHSFNAAVETGLPDVPPASLTEDDLAPPCLTERASAA